MASNVVTWWYTAGFTPIYRGKNPQIATFAQFASDYDRPLVDRCPRKALFTRESEAALCDNRPLNLARPALNGVGNGAQKRELVGESV